MQLTLSVFEKALSWTSTSLEKARILVEMYLAFVITESSEEKNLSPYYLNKKFLEFISQS